MCESISPLFASEITDCVSEGRHPTVTELSFVADRIESEADGGRQIFRWDNDSKIGIDQGVAMRTAHLALCGSGHGAIDGCWQAANPFETSEIRPATNG